MSCEEPKPKKMKTKTEKDAAEEEGGGTSAEVPVALKNDAGESYFQLSDKRRIVIREFKSNTLIDIREFYEKGDKVLPGKKGISLTLDQYEVLKDLIVSGGIDNAIESMGGSE